MRFAYGFAMTVERPGTPDRHGNATATQHSIERCMFDFTTTTERIDGESVTVTRQRVLCDSITADVRPRDVLVHPDGGRWQVTGEPSRESSGFSGWSPGCVIPVERARD